MLKSLKLATLLSMSICTAAGFAQSDSMPIGPGDQLHVQVLEAPELEQHGRVTDAGNFPLIYGGDVHLAGLTVDAAAGPIEKVLVDSHYLVTAHVSVTIERSANRNVTILGQVKSPGVYPISTPKPALDVIALAGGLTPSANREITITRADTKEKVEYVLSNDPKSAIDQSPMINPGDSVFVPEAPIVYVLGDVRRPGGYQATATNSKISVLQAVALAGSTTPSAVPSQARLLRRMPDGRQVLIPLQLSEMQKGRRADMDMQPNDIIYVPFSYLRNMASNLSTIVAAAATASVYKF